MIDQGMSPSLQEIHEIDFIFFLFVVFLDIAVDSSPIFFMEDFSDFLLIHEWILSDWLYETKKRYGMISVLRLVVIELFMNGWL